MGERRINILFKLAGNAMVRRKVFESLNSATGNVPKIWRTSQKRDYAICRIIYCRWISAEASASRITKQIAARFMAVYLFLNQGYTVAANRRLLCAAGRQSRFPCWSAACSCIPKGVPLRNSHATRCLKPFQVRVAVVLLAVFTLAAAVLAALNFAKRALLASH